MMMESREMKLWGRCRKETQRQHLEVACSIRREGDVFDRAAVIVDHPLSKRSLFEFGAPNCAIEKPLYYLLLVGDKQPVKRS